MKQTFFNAGDVARAGKVLDAINSPVKLKIMESLLEKERTVTQLIKITKLKQSGVSAYLRNMKDCGLIIAPDTQPYGCYKVDKRNAQHLKYVIDALVKISS